MSEGSEIWGRRRRLRRRNDRPEELATNMEASSEEDYTKVFTTTTEASIEEAENTTRLSERLQRKMRQYVYGKRVLMTTVAASKE